MSLDYMNNIDKANVHLSILDPWYMNGKQGIRIPAAAKQYSIYVVTDVLTQQLATIDDDFDDADIVLGYAATLDESKLLTNDGDKDDVITLDGEVEVQVNAVYLEEICGATNDGDEDDVEVPDENGRVLLADVDTDAEDDENEEENLYLAQQEEEVQAAAEEGNIQLIADVYETFKDKRFKLEFTNGVLVNWTVL